MQGRPGRDEEPHSPDVQVRDMDGNLVGVGKLLDLAPRGAQVELDHPLAPTLSYTVALAEGGAARLVTGEVRWVRKVGDRFQHGFALRDSAK